MFNLRLTNNEFHALYGCLNHYLYRCKLRKQPTNSVKYIKTLENVRDVMTEMRNNGPGVRKRK